MSRTLVVKPRPAALIDVGPDGRCQDDLPVGTCALCRPGWLESQGIATAVETPVTATTRNYGRPARRLLETTRSEEFGTTQTWYPYKNQVIDPGAVEIHIAGPFSAEHIKQILRASRKVVRITFAPSNANRVKRVLGLLGANDIAVATRRLNMI